MLILVSRLYVKLVVTYSFREEPETATQSEDSDSDRQNSYSFGRHDEQTAEDEREAEDEQIAIDERTIELVQGRAVTDTNEVRTMICVSVVLCSCLKVLVAASTL